MDIKDFVSAIDNTLKDSAIGRLYCDDYDGTQEIEDALTDSKFFPKTAHIASGATKVCIYEEDSDVVVKIPLEGTMCYDNNEDNDEDTDEFVPFYAGNYAERELDYWEEIKNIPLIRQCFAAEEFYGTVYGNTPIYIQKKVTPYDGYDSDQAKCSEEIRTKAKNLSDKTSIFIRLDVIALLIRDYGEDAAAAACEFCSDRNIKDIRLGNCGYDANNKIKIFDYASYEEC